MTFNITIGPSLHGSDSSLSDEEDSSGVQVSPPSDTGSHDYEDSYDEWAHLSYPDELKPSDSASRPRTSNRTRSRNPINSLPSDSGRRRSSRRHGMQERRSRRQPSPESPESLDSSEEYAAPYGRASQEKRLWPPMVQGSNYTHSSSPGPSYVYSSNGISPGAFPQPGLHLPPDQVMRLGHHHQAAQPGPYSHPVYGYGPQYQNPHGSPITPFFFHEHHPGHHMPLVHSSPQGRNDGHSPQQQQIPHPIPPHGPSQYGGHPLGPHDLIPYGAGGYYPVREPYAMVHPSYLNAYPRAPSPSQEESSPTSAPAPTDPAKDEAIARLEKLILEERTEREAKEAREAALQAAAEKEAAEQAARKERAAHEKKIVEEAAAAARAEAEQKAAEEAAKAKKEAEEAAAAAAAEAAAKARKEAEEAAAAAAEEAAAKAAEAANAATAEAVAAATAAATAAASKKVPEKKKPIKFKDAVGRKFSFPFDLCCTWQGMEELIRQAFLHIEVIGPHVAEGRYDLVGPNGDIILPQVWETVIEPDWTITMHMWPIPEKPKTPEPAPTPEAAEGPENNLVVVAPEEPKKKPEPAVTKKPRPKAPDPSAFAMWMVGSNRLRLNKALKAGKKPKAFHHHGSSCRVM